jgi:hypothetical protein
VVMQPCLTCHGSPEKIPAEVRQAIQKGYPEDRGSVYRNGGFRGIIDVTIPAKHQSSGQVRIETRRRQSPSELQRTRSDPQ